MRWWKQAFEKAEELRGSGGSRILINWPRRVISRPTPTNGNEGKGMTLETAASIPDRLLQGM